MSIREFADGAGVRWRVWATIPLQGNVRPQFSKGWLAFECADERRRLAPIPAGWPDADEAAICAYLAQAVVITRGAGSLLHAQQTASTAVAPQAPTLESTVAKVRAVIRSVEQTLGQEQPAG